MKEVLIKPEIKVEKLEIDPTFEAGSVHTAVATLTNPTTKSFTYTTEMYLGVLKAASSGVSAPFTLAPGVSINMNYPITMPLVEGEYEVYIDVWVGTELIAHYQAKVNGVPDNVTIAISPAIQIGPITWA